jgi:N-acetylmuramoyl-L-alanine amidase
MSNSSLINYTLLSPNHSGARKYPLTKITIHHMAGNLSVEQCGQLFQNRGRPASSNYGIGTDGRVGLYVDEKNRAWTSASYDNDNRAVTIEVANDEIGGNWHVSDAALEKCIELCTDICRRNGIKALNYTGNPSGNLTMHCWFAQTACPGPYLKSKLPDIAEEVNRRLNAAQPVETNALYKVQIGAFRSKANAQALAEKAKAQGFTVIIVEEKR